MCTGSGVCTPQDARSGPTGCQWVIVNPKVVYRARRQLSRKSHIGAHHRDYQRSHSTTRVGQTARVYASAGRWKPILGAGTVHNAVNIAMEQVPNDERFNLTRRALAGPT